MQNKVSPFEAISDFVADLHSIYENDKPLYLYNKLIEKITVRDKTAIKKQITIFSNYVTKNLQLILSHKLSQLPQIVWNKEKGIYIDIAMLTKDADQEILTNIENHLLTISMIMNPNDMKIRETLLSHFAKQVQTTNSEGGKEQELVSKFMGNIASASEQGGDIGQVMMSGFQMIPNIISGISSGEIDPMKFMGAAFQTMQQLGGNQDPGMLANMMNPEMMQTMMNPEMMQTMMGQFQNMSLETPKEESKE